ncbi:MAG: hypothetical protein CML66_25850 [Rhodobacteraceae bacterium]|nr:hypothetical protein [Paracoccaceae bacterium]MAY44652.1 hypothetical protein [Paracoccaceae bacterium]
MASDEELTAQLTAAEDALHRLMIGESEVVIAYDGHRTEYKAADQGALQRYINTLKRQLGQCAPRAVRRVTF